MQTDGVMCTGLPKQGQSSATLSKKILGVDFNEVKWRQCFKQFAIVRMTPANADGHGTGWGCSH